MMMGVYSSCHQVVYMYCDTYLHCKHIPDLIDPQQVTICCNDLSNISLQQFIDNNNG